MDQTPDLPSDPQDPTTALIDGTTARATWSFGGDRVMASTQKLPEDARDALRWFFYYALENEISRQDAATLLKVDQTTIFRVYSGTYRDAAGKLIVPKKLVESIQTFRRIEEKRADLGKVPFVLTPTARRIWQVCDLVQTSNRIGSIWGTSQTGKTTALEEYRRQNNHGQTKMIRIEPQSGTHELMRQLGRECALSVKTSFDNLKHRVRRSVDHNNLIIVDEIHELAFTYRQRSKLSCIELLRWLHDVTKCGMILCGTNLWRDELREGKDKRFLEQIDRRGVFNVQLPSEPTDGDLRAIFGHYELTWPTGFALEMIRDVNRRQGLTAITEFLRFGKRIAKDEPLAWDHVVDAYLTITQLETGKDPRK